MIAQGIFTRALAVLALVLFAHGGAVTAPALAAQADAQQPAGARLPDDTRLVRGELANGLRYAIMPNAEPPGRVQLWLHVHAGSLHEAEDQRGLAHFLEHMAFNGSASFPPGTVVDFFQDMGMTFGRHQNAVTGFDRTGYTLSLPDTEDQTIERGLRFLRDVAGGLLLLEGEIEAERPIILEERRASLSPQQRILYELIERIAPGSRFGRRLPIGTEEVIRTAPRERFVAFYDRWYVPSNMTLVVVGDISPKAMAARIADAMGGLDPAQRPTPPDPGVTRTEGYRAIVADDPEETREEVAINLIAPARGPTLTEADYRRDLVERLGQRMFNDRLDDLVRRGEVAMLTGSASAGDFAGAIRWTQVSARGEPGTWPTMLEELGRELRRATLHGFNPDELEDARRELRAAAERAVETDRTRPSPAVRARLVEAVASGEPMPSAAQQLELVGAMLPTITLEEVSRAFARAFAFEDAVFTLQTREDAGTPDEPALLEAGVRALEATPEPLEAADRADALLASLPAAGEVVRQAHHEATGVTSAWLSNGVRLRVRPMREREDRVSVVITAYGGLVEETPENRGVTDAASRAFAQPASGRLSSSQIEDLMTGLKVSVRGGSDAAGLRLTVGGGREDLERGLELAHLLLTDPLLEPSALRLWKRGQIRTIETLEQVPQGAAVRALIDALYPKDEVRQRLLTREQVNAITREQAQAWLDRLVATAPIEVAIVGDITPDDALSLAERYLGSLPERPRVSASTHADLRAIERPQGPRTRTVRPTLATPQAFVVAGFYGVDESDATDRRGLRLAARVLSTRMIERIREGLGLAYSPSASSRTATTFPGFGLFSVQAPTAPESAERLADELEAMFSRFAADGPTPEELRVARDQFATVHEESVRDPGYWVRSLRDMDYVGTTLDDLAAEATAYQRFTPEDVRAIFDRYHGDDGRVRVLVIPRSPQDAGGEGDEAGS